jgi:transcription factor STE12
MHQNEQVSYRGSNQVKESLRLIEDLKFFLATAPANWQENQVIRRYYLNHDEGFVSCVFWNNLYFITGTDIVRCIVYKFEHLGRKIVDRKKFEEGIFSDLRNLKCGTDAILELPRSEFLEFLFKNSCLRTQKKQKVFFWFNVPHDKLVIDALERDLKKEKQGQAPTTIAASEPALSFKYDEDQNLSTQFQKHLDLQGDFATALSLGTASEILSPTLTTNPTSSVKHERIPNQNPLTHDQDDNADDENDFPLDYFTKETEQMDYINLDPNYLPGSYNTLVDENFDSLVDDSIFVPGQNSASNPIIYNDEYLIEQAQPLKASIPVLPGSRPTNYMTVPFTGDDYTQMKPLSAKNQMAFSTRLLVGQPASQYYPQSFYQPIPDGTPNLGVPPQEYWSQPSGGFTGMDPAYQPYYEQDFYPVNNMYPVLTPVVVQQPYPITPTNRQQFASSLNRKKRPSFPSKTTSKVSKPSIDKDKSSRKIT